MNECLSKSEKTLSFGLAVIPILAMLLLLIIGYEQDAGHAGGGGDDALRFVGSVGQPVNSNATRGKASVLSMLAAPLR